MKNGGKTAFGKKRADAQKRKKAGFTADEALARNPAGVISVARSGTGFVNADDGGADIMIPESETAGALHGDRVEVALCAPRPGDARRSGRVLRVLERSGAETVCTLRRNGAYLTAVPLLPNVKCTFNIEDPRGAGGGERVIVRMSAWPNPHLNPEGEITAVIGPADNPSLDTLSIISAWGLPGDFHAAAEEEAAHVSARLGESVGREDLRALETITIDPGSARDFDDALSLRTDAAAGARTLGVHIADVTHFVTPGSALDREAAERGVSVYLPDKVIPMLPEQLSNGVCSLVPGEDRLAFSAFLTFDPAGRIISRRFARSVIRSKRRFTYEEAQEIIGAAAPAAAEPPHADLVRSLHHLAQQLRANRFKRYALDIAAPEMEVVLDASGMMTGMRPAAHMASHELVEEAMVAANEAVAAELSARRIPYISRLHEPPDAEKTAELAASATALGLSPGDLSHPGNLARFIKSVRGAPLENYVSSLVLKSMKRAEYAVGKEGHFGLAKRFYAHFTSPIRRYPDLLLHRQLAAALTDGGAAAHTRGELSRFAKTSTELEYRAEQAERDLIEIKKYRFLEAQLAGGAPLAYDAAAVSVLSFGVFVEVPALQVGGMIHISTLSEKFVRYEPAVPRFSTADFSLKPGDKLRVIVSRVNFDERKIDFAAVDLPPPAGADEASARGRVGTPPPRRARKADSKPGRGAERKPAGRAKRG